LPIIAAGTGLRPEERLALERRDVDKFGEKRFDRVPVSVGLAVVETRGGERGLPVVSSPVVQIQVTTAQGPRTAAGCRSAPAAAVAVGWLERYLQECEPTLGQAFCTSKNSVLLRLEREVSDEEVPAEAPEPATSGVFAIAADPATATTTDMGAMTFALECKFTADVACQTAPSQPCSSARARQPAVEGA
jgi:hypothetical protein